MHPSRKLGRGKTGCNGEAWGSGRGRVDNGHRDFARFAADVRASDRGEVGLLWRRGAAAQPGRRHRERVGSPAVARRGGWKKATARLWTDSVVSRRAGLLCVFFRSGLVLQDRRKSDYWD